MCKRRSKRKHNEHWLVEGMERGEGEEMDEKSVAVMAL